MQDKVTFRGFPPDAQTAQAALRNWGLLNRAHGPLRECTVVVLNQVSEDGSVPRCKVCMRMEARHLGRTVIAEPVTRDDLLMRAVERAFKRADEILTRRKTQAQQGPHIAWAGEGGRF